MNRKAIYTSAVVSLALLFATCDMAGTNPEWNSGYDGKAAVQVLIGSQGLQSRTVAPSVELAGTDWRLLGGTGEDETQLAKFSDGDRTVYLDPGTWSFTLEGSKNGALILRGNLADQAISLDSPNTLDFTVAPVLDDREGTVSITIELPDGFGITEARIRKDGVELETPVTPADNRIVFEQTYTAGDYYFSVQLYKGDELYGVVSEVVQVRANLESAKTYTLTWEDLNRIYVITYHLWGNETEPGYYQHTDAALTLEAPTRTRTGYTFTGWYDKPDWSGEPVTEILTGSTGDKTFYANWTPVQYTVTFNAADGSPDPGSQSVAHGGNVTRPTPDPSKAGYTFDDWYNGETPWNFSTDTVTGNITLTAHWTVMTYTVTFDTDGGSAIEGSQSVAYGGNVTRPTPDPSKAGYTFDDWYNGETPWNFSTDTVTGNITLTVHWVAVRIFTVTFSRLSDEEIDLSHEGGQTLSQSNWDSLTVSLSGIEDYDSKTWYVDGEYGYYYSDEGYHIYAFNFSLGPHTVSAVVVKDGVPYSKTLRFQVTK